MATTVESLQKRMQLIDSTIAAAEGVLREKSYDLVLKVDDKELAQEVESLEGEIAASRRERGRVEAAIHETARRNSVGEKRKRLADMTEHRAAIQKAGKEALSITRKLLEQVEKLSPLLADLDAVLTTRRRLAHAVLSELPDRPRRTYLERGLGAADWRQSVLPTVVAAALWRSGLGRVGPHLSPWVEVLPPRDGKGDSLMRCDLTSAMQANAERADEVLAQGLDAALQAMTAELGQP